MEEITEEKIQISNGDRNVDDLIEVSTSIAKPVKLDKNILDTLGYAECLDRYDDFDSLKIKTSCYLQQEGSKYGIKLGDFHYSEDPILPHQEAAATAFLRHLRGFGLLADCVGSGKTFEAGLVLSELAYRGKIKSMLFVVPEQTFDHWKNVIENKFGLGEGVLKKVERVPTRQLDSIGGGLYRPQQPWIVTTENFAKWPENDIKNILFDVIVVDEAHHLCIERGEYAKALKLLSIMMQIKKKANVPYCILLSATPHSGNLENMFRLWYFIRCKGGFPHDFDEMEDGDRSIDYNREKEFYLKTICKGASTVAEFIQITKKQLLEGDGSIRGFLPKYQKFLVDEEAFDKYNEESESKRRSLRDKFLKKEESIRSNILQEISKAYHNGVMRSIMIRQPNDHNRYSRIVHNYYFCPVNREVVLEGRKSPSKDEKIEVFGIDGNEKYFELGDLFDRYLNSISSDNEVFSKQNSSFYYKEQWTKSNNDTDGSKISIQFFPFQKEEFSKSLLDAKLKRFIKIAAQHEKNRIIVFFNYDFYEKCKEEDKVATWAWLNMELQKIEGMKDRVIFVEPDSDKQEIHKRFEEKSDAILIVGDKALTEGENFQICNVLVNFEVTNDPLAMDQRIGRVFRLGQSSNVEIISLAAMNELEGYCLTYFDAIGLLRSVNGDATIIAGSSNEKMVAIKCPVCGKVELLSRTEYEDRKNTEKLFCDYEPRCRVQDKRGTIMAEINVFEFKCDNNSCGVKLTRGIGDEGYQCFSVGASSKSKLANVGLDYFCQKACVIRHCKRFDDEPLKTKCAIKSAKITPTYAECFDFCLQCEESFCPEQCKVTNFPKESIEECKTCRYAECKPFSIHFEVDGEWVAQCPVCKTGHLRQLVTHTFAAYIQSAYEFKDNGASFCDNLLKEANRTSEIREILKQDKV